VTFLSSSRPRLRRPGRRTVVGAAGLAATLVAAYWAGRLTHDDLPDLEVEAISPQDAR